MICLLEGWIRKKTGSKCKQMYFIPETTQIIFGGLTINNKYCSTFTFMYLGCRVAQDDISFILALKTASEKTKKFYKCKIFHNYLVAN
jgi:hypothetical protein